MAEVTPYESLGELHASRTEKRSNIVVTGAAVISAALLVGYAGLTGLYAGIRADVISEGLRWLPSGVDIPLTQPNYMGLSIFLSFVTIWWAVISVRNDDRSNALLAQVMTFVFAAGFIVQAFYLFSILEMDAGASEQAVLIYTMAGVHLVALVVAMGGLFLTFFRTAVGDLVGGKSEALTALAIYWTAVAIVYSILWYTVYITK